MRSLSGEEFVFSSAGYDSSGGKGDQSVLVHEAVPEDADSLSTTPARKYYPIDLPHYFQNSASGFQCVPSTVEDVREWNV